MGVFHSICMIMSLVVKLDLIAVANEFISDSEHLWYFYLNYMHIATL